MPVQRKKRDLTNEAMFRPLAKKRYSEQIAEMIQNRILKDRLEIGTGLLSEKELALEFQVSRSVIREALRILEISGLVNIKKGPSGGIFVSHVYHKPIKHSLNNMITSGEVTIDHLFDVRMLIEPRIAMEAALHAKEEDAKRLSSIPALYRAQGKPCPPPYEAVSQFHKTVIPGEQNDVERDPWFDRLTTLSEVEGESRKLVENQIILDPGSHPAPRDLAGMTNCDTASYRVRGLEGVKDSGTWLIF